MLKKKEEIAETKCEKILRLFYGEEFLLLGRESFVHIFFLISFLITLFLGKEPEYTKESKM